MGKTLFCEMTGFAGWNLFGNLAAITFTQGLNLLLNMFFGPVVNAARGIAVQAQTAIGQFSNNFQTALNPQITKSYATGDREYMHSLIFRSAKFSFFLLLFLSLPILIETKAILTLWLKIVPDHTVVFLRIMLCTTWVYAISNPLITAASATGKIKLYQSVVGGLLLLILPISYLCLRLGLPAYSVFIVHLGMEITAQFARLWMLRRMIRLSLREYFTKVIWRISKVTNNCACSASGRCILAAGRRNMEPSDDLPDLRHIDKYVRLLVRTYIRRENIYILESLIYRIKIQNMISITSKEMCCGCAACEQRCPKSCIVMREDEEGFLYPQTDMSKCIDCGFVRKSLSGTQSGRKEKAALCICRKK